MKAWQCANYLLEITQLGSGKVLTCTLGRGQGRESGGDERGKKENDRADKMTSSTHLKEYCLLQNTKHRATTHDPDSLLSTYSRNIKTNIQEKNQYMYVHSSIIHESGNNLSIHQLMNG